MQPLHVWRAVKFVGPITPGVARSDAVGLPHLTVAKARMVRTEVAVLAAAAGGAVLFAYLADRRARQLAHELRAKAKELEEAKAEGAALASERTALQTARSSLETKCGELEAALSFAIKREEARSRLDAALTPEALKQQGADRDARRAALEERRAQRESKELPRAPPLPPPAESATLDHEEAELLKSPEAIARARERESRAAELDAQRAALREEHESRRAAQAERLERRRAKLVADSERRRNRSSERGALAAELNRLLDQTSSHDGAGRNGRGTPPGAPTGADVEGEARAEEACAEGSADELTAAASSRTGRLQPAALFP